MGLLLRDSLYEETTHNCSSSDIATQMRYLTDIPESPCLKRTSRVLSWISESEDMFEDTGASREHTDGCECLIDVYNRNISCETIILLCNF